MEFILQQNLCHITVRIWLFIGICMYYKTSSFSWFYLIFCSLFELFHFKYTKTTLQAIPEKMKVTKKMKDNDNKVFNYCKVIWQIIQLNYTLWKWTVQQYNTDQVVALFESLYIERVKEPPEIVEHTRSPPKANEKNKHVQLSPTRKRKIIHIFIINNNINCVLTSIPVVIQIIYRIVFRFFARGSLNTCSKFLFILHNLQTLFIFVGKLIISDTKQ